MKATPNIEAFISEVQRLADIAPIGGMPRVIREDCVIGKHFLPKDTVVLMNFTNILSNPDIFDNPLELR